MKPETYQLHRRLLVCIIFIAAGVGTAQSLFGPIQTGDTAGFNAALQAGADINAADEYGQTPLMYAVTFNQPDMVEGLIAAGADVNARTLADWTALHYAARDATESRILRSLLNAGANPAARNQAGDTPHAVATSVANRAAAETLEAAAASQAPPIVTGTQPQALPSLDERQWITVTGSGFAPDAVVTLTWGNTDFTVPVERTAFVDARSIRVFAGVFPADSTWTARVTNPNGAVSNRHSLQFEDPRAVAEAGTTTAQPPTASSDSPAGRIAQNSPAGRVAHGSPLPDGTRTLGVVETSTDDGTFYCYGIVETFRKQGLEFAQWKGSMGWTVDVFWTSSFLSTGADGKPLSSSTVELVFSDAYRTTPRVGFRYSASDLEFVSLEDAPLADGMTLFNRILQHQGTIEIIVTERVLSPTGVLTQETKTMRFVVTQPMIRALREGFGVYCLNRY